jgi:hypothetical protein
MNGRFTTDPTIGLMGAVSDPRGAFFSFATA